MAMKIYLVHCQIWHNSGNPGFIIEEFRIDSSIRDFMIQEINVFIYKELVSLMEFGGGGGGGGVEVFQNVVARLTQL